MKKTKQKTINDYREFIQSIKRISKVRHRKWCIKEKCKKLWEKHLTTDLINHHRKQQEFFEGKRKRHYKK